MDSPIMLEMLGEAHRQDILEDAARDHLGEKFRKPRRSIRARVGRFLYALATRVDRAGEPDLVVKPAADLA
jgi:hypothetical protein